MNLTHLLTACAMDAGRMGIPADAAVVWLYGPDAFYPLMVAVLRPERPEMTTPKTAIGLYKRLGFVDRALLLELQV